MERLFYWTYRFKKECEFSFTYSITIVLPIVITFNH